MSKPRIHVVQIDLDLDLEEEIKKATAVSDEIKVHIKGFLEEKKARKSAAPKRKPTPPEWLPAMEAIFGALQAAENGSLTKEEMAKAASVEPDGIGPVIQRFKSYLRAEKENDWHLEIKVRSKVRTYRLQKVL